MTLTGHREYRSPAPVVTGYKQDAAWYAVAPPTVAIVNIVANPSIETNTTGYTAVGGTVAQSIVRQRRGAYSLLVTPTAGVNDGVYYGTVTTAANKNYPWSFDIWANAGYKYKAYWATTGGVLVGSEVKFVGRGRWIRVQVPYYETAATTRRLYIIKDNQTNVRPFYVDGMLIPSGAEDLEEWRYFDGSTLGFIPNQVDFYWNGTPNGSTSTMRPNSRAGGRIIPLARYGVTVLAMLGLGMKTPTNVSLPLALPGGASYQRTLSPANDFSLAATVTATGQQDLRSKQVALKALFDVRQQPVTQPLILQYEPLDECGDASGERTEVVCSFAGGLEGQWDNHYQENVNLKFTNFLPWMAVSYGQAAATLDVRDQFTAGYVARRSVDGIWSALQTSGLNSTVRAILPMPDGRWLLGGAFTDAGGAGDADNLAYYDPATDTLSAVNATPLAGEVDALLLLPDGNVLVGGVFQNAVTASGDFLIKLTVSTGVFSVLNATPLNNAVTSLALLLDGNVAVGGLFTDATRPYLCKLTISTGAYSSFLAGVLNGVVLSLATAPSGILYIGGAFTDAGGFTLNDKLALLPSPYTALREWTGNTALNGSVYTILPASDGSVLIGGQFTDVNGDTTWDFYLRSIQAPPGGSSSPIPLIWTRPFRDISAAVYSIAEPRPGTIVVGGGFTSVNGVALFDGMFQYSGATLLPIDLDLPGTAIVYALGSRLNGELIAGIDQTGTSSTSGTATVTNPGTAPSKPVIVINLPTTATLIAPLYSIRSLTTGKVISFSLSLLIGETLTIDLTTNSVTSDLRGNLISTVLPGSNVDSFYLVPGPNIINIFSSLASGSLPTAYIYWTPAYSGVADAGPL